MVEGVGTLDRAPSRGVRGFVLGFLAVFIACGLLSVEVWPLTGFRLYHQLRHEERVSWVIVAETAGGDREVDLQDLPIGWHETNRLLSTFPELSGDERDAICDAWVEPLRASGVVVTGVRVDEVHTHLSSGDRSTREAYRCGS